MQREKAPLPFAKRRYEYDAAGQLTRIDDADEGYTDYRYDPLGRLLEAIEPGERERFAFDPASNIVDVPAAEAARDRTFVTREESSLPPQVPKVMGNLLKAYAGMHFSYDARGNLAHKQSPSGQQRYEWDGFNRLQAVSVQEASRRCEARYVYDALGRRIAKEVNGERTVFGWDGDTLAYESDEHGSTHYVYEPGSFVPLAQYVTAPVAGMATPVRKENDRYTPEDDPLQRRPERVGDAHVFYYHCDQIGTPLLMTDDASEVVWEASYKAWGETQKVIERASQAAGITTRNAIRFQGQQLDEESGLHYNRYRYYDPSAGRFISMDPIGLRGGINVYQYGLNSVSWTDPLGLMPWKWNPNGMGHHLVWRKKAESCGLSHLATERDTPTYFPNPYSPGDHEALHRAQSKDVGGRQGAWAGSADELLHASGKGLEGMTMTGDLKIPSTGEVLAKDVTPAEAYKALMEWHAVQMKRKCP